MRIISMISARPGCGRTTVAVNLAAGLICKGLTVLIAETSPSKKICEWLGISEIKPNQTMLPEAEHDTPFKITGTRLGMDLLQTTDTFPSLTAVPDLPPSLNKLDYDYILFLPADGEDCRHTCSFANLVLVCTDLSINDEDELETFKTLENALQTARTKTSGIDLIVPNRIDTKEWDHNTAQLFNLADFFGFEKLADPIPG